MLDSVTIVIMSHGVLVQHKYNEEEGEGTSMDLKRAPWGHPKQTRDERTRHGTNADQFHWPGVSA